jgi:hypothetical protein
MSSRSRMRGPSALVVSLAERDLLLHRHKSRFLVAALLGMTGLVYSAPLLERACNPSCHSEEVAVATDEESALAVKARRSRFLSRPGARCSGAQCACGVGMTGGDFHFAIPVAEGPWDTQHDRYPCSATSYTVTAASTLRR